MDYDARAMAEAFKQNLKAFVGICRAMEITPVLMTQQSRYKNKPLDRVVRYEIGMLERDYGVGYSEFKSMFDSFNETIREVSAEKGVLLIDLAEEIPQDKRYIYDQLHLNTTGSKLASTIICGELKTIEALPDSAPR